MFKTNAVKTRSFNNEMVKVTRESEAIIKTLKNSKGEDYLCLSFIGSVDGRKAEFCEYRRLDNREATEAKAAAFNAAEVINVELSMAKQSSCVDDKGRKATFTTFWGHGLTESYKETSELFRF